MVVHVAIANFPHKVGDDATHLKDSASSGQRLCTGIPAKADAIEPETRKSKRTYPESTSYGDHERWDMDGE